MSGYSRMRWSKEEEDHFRTDLIPFITSLTVGTGAECWQMTEERWNQMAKQLNWPQRTASALQTKCSALRVRERNSSSKDKPIQRCFDKDQRAWKWSLEEEDYLFNHIYPQLKYGIDNLKGERNWEIAVENFNSHAERKGWPLRSIHTLSDKIKMFRGNNPISRSILDEDLSISEAPNADGESLGHLEQTLLPPSSRPPNLTGSMYVPPPNSNRYPVGGNPYIDPYTNAAATPGSSIYGGYFQSGPSTQTYDTALPQSSLYSGHLQPGPSVQMYGPPVTPQYPQSSLYQVPYPGPPSRPGAYQPTSTDSMAHNSIPDNVNINPWKITEQDQTLTTSWPASELLDDELYYTLMSEPPPRG